MAISSQFSPNDLGRLAPSVVGQLANLLSVGVVIADRDGSATFVNRAWLEMTGQAEDVWQGYGWLEALDESERAVQRDLLRASVLSGETFKADWVVTSSTSGRRVLQVRTVPEQPGELTGAVVATVIDLTDETAAVECLSHQATHDPLTGLYNRGQFLEFVSHSLDRQRRAHNGLAAVFFIDVDGLKAINDHHGHSAGDRLLRTAAARISASVRPVDVVARYGGDEFAVLCDDLADDQEAALIEARIRDISDRGSADDQGVRLSVGMALVDDPDLSPAMILERADRAMYLAKRGFTDRATEPKSTAPQDGRPRPTEDVETILAAAAHELRTPLATIAGFASLLHEDRDRMSPDDVEAGFTVIERQSAWLGEVLEDVLELGRTHNESEVAESMLLDDAVSDALEAAPPPEGIRLSIHRGASPLPIHAGRRGMARVVVNLLTNAYRHGGSRITVDLERRFDQAILSVADDGDGVPDWLVPSLFRPFARGGPSGSAGAGLGLALSREIVQSVGGTIDYVPVEPHGARLVITLPVDENPPD